MHQNSVQYNRAIEHRFHQTSAFGSELIHHNIDRVFYAEMFRACVIIFPNQIIFSSVPVV